MTNATNGVEANPAAAVTESAPSPVARALVFVFLSVLGMIILTQIVAIYNRERLSGLLSSYATEQAAMRNLAFTLFEIENANAEIRDWVLSDDPEAELNTPLYSLHVATARETLSRITEAPARYRGIRDTISAALEDLDNRSRIVMTEMAEGRRDRARLVARDRRSLSLSFTMLGEVLRESRQDFDLLQSRLFRETQTLEISLTVINTAMILAAIALVFLWKRLVALH